MKELKKSKKILTKQVRSLQYSIKYLESKNEKLVKKMSKSKSSPTSVYIKQEPLDYDHSVVYHVNDDGNDMDVDEQVAKATNKDVEEEAVEVINKEVEESNEEEEESNEEVSNEEVVEESKKEVVEESNEEEEVIERGPLMKDDQERINLFFKEF